MGSCLGRGSSTPLNNLRFPEVRTVPHIAADDMLCPCACASHYGVFFPLGVPLVRPQSAPQKFVEAQYMIVETAILCVSNKVIQCPSSSRPAYYEP